MPDDRLFAIRPLLLAACAAACAAHAQVTPSEPFGGRPFGSAPGTPPPQPQQPANVMGAAAPTVVQVIPPAPAPVPLAVPAPPPQTVGPGAAIQGSRTTGQLPAAATGQAPVAAPVPPSQPVTAAPAQGTMTPPFNAPARGVPAAGAASAAAASAQPPVRGLPADAPKLVVTGSVFSPDPTKRLLIVNGQVYREGADLGSGVVLQEVHKESAVLGFKGNRYTVMF